MVRGKKNPSHLGLPTRLKRTRRRCGLKQRPLAIRAGIAPSTVGDIENGTQIPTAGSVARLACALSVSAAWLGFAIGEVITDEGAATCDRMGERLRLARVERGYTKAALARLSNLSPRAIGKIESGGQSGIDVIEDLAKVLTTSPAWLAFNQGPREVPRRRLASSTATPLYTPNA